MTRTTTGAFDTAVTSPHVPCIVFVEIDLVSGFLRLCSAPYNWSWNTYTWTGLGHLGKIEKIKESSTGEAHGLALQISGVPSATISSALAEQYQGRNCKIWFAPLNPDTYAVIADPLMIFWGLLDTMSIELGETATITVTAESKLADWDRPRTQRYNHADQIAVYPDDLGFEFVEKVTDCEIKWGRE